MRKPWIPLLFSACILVALGGAPASPSPQTPSQAPTAEQQFKNIQVLKGLPASQLLRVMHLMRASLGVRCDHCHVTENDQYDRDDKKPKQVARRMISMMLEMNKTYFDGAPVLTCNSCHQGRVEPVAVAPIGQGLFPDTTRSPSIEQAPLPTASQVLQRYVEAVGGREALERTTTSLAEGVLYRIRVDDPGTPSARAVNRGEAVPMEIALEAPNKFRIELSTPQGKVSQSYDGTTGWLITPQGKRPLTPAEIARIGGENDIRAPLTLAERALPFSVAAIDLVDGRKAFRLEGISTDGRVEQLWFDVETGLLRRRIRLTPTPVGPDPEQTDYEDYRDVSGVKIPFRVKASFLDDNHLGTTKAFNQVRHNAKLP